MSASRRTVYRSCTLCEATCGLAMEVEADRIVSVRGDEDDVFSRRRFGTRWPASIIVLPPKTRMPARAQASKTAS